MATYGNNSVQLCTSKAKAAYTGLYAYSSEFIKTWSCSEPNQTTEMDPFAKIVNGFQSLTIFVKTLHLRYLAEF